MRPDCNRYEMCTAGLSGASATPTAYVPRPSMNIQAGEARVSRAGLGRGCTLMQWFILFGLRASWTSSIIVIHRRKWAARGGAGAGGGPRADAVGGARHSVASRHSRCQYARAAMHVVSAWLVRSVCVCPAWSQAGARRAVQCPEPSAPPEPCRTS